MKRSLSIVLAMILVFAGIFAGVSIWQYNRQQNTFGADGYIITGLSDTDVVALNYFSQGTVYKDTYEDQIQFTNSLGVRETVKKNSFVHYMDTSITSFKEGMLADLDQVNKGYLDLYYLAPEMVLTGKDGLYEIDNNGSSLNFTDYLWMIEEKKFLIYAGGGMTLTLANGTDHSVESGYLEFTYLEDNIIQVCNEENIWQAIASGCRLTLSNGLTLDLGTGEIVDSEGNPRLSLQDIAADLAAGTGMAIASDSAQNWTPPTFEFETVDGTDGTNGSDGDAGEEGTAGDEGQAGTEGTAGDEGSQGETGANGANGSAGAAGQSGTNGAGGSDGLDGADGGSGGSGASPGSGNGADSAGTALGKVIISSMDYDCENMSVTFYAEDNNNTFSGANSVAKAVLVETATNTVVRTLTDGEEWDGIVLAAATDTNPVTLNFSGLAPDTEYTLLIYSDYSVDNGKLSGNKVFASRSFYTSTEGVTMAVHSMTEHSVTLMLTKNAYSKVNFANVRAKFSFTNDSGELIDVVADLGSDVADFTKGKDTCLVTLDLTSYLGGITDAEGDTDLYSNIPFTLNLYTTEEAGSAAVEVNSETNEIRGLEDGTAQKSGQVLTGTTLKKTPTYGKLNMEFASGGYYALSVSGIQDPDSAIQSYTYQIFDEKGTMVKQLVSYNEKAVELYIDNESITYGSTYQVKCLINYYDNEKYYDLKVSDYLKVDTGEATVWFEWASLDQNVDLGVSGKLPEDFLTEGVSYLYGYLVVDCTGAGISLENTQEMLVTVSSGSSYQESMSYTVTDALKEVQTDGTVYLRMPVWMYGLKQDSVYTFTVSGYVKYSNATSAYRTVGAASTPTRSYSETLIYSLDNLTGKPLDENNPTGDKYDSALALGIRLQGTGKSTSNIDQKDPDEIPIEVLSARAVEVTFSELDETGKVLYSQPVVVDLYEKRNMYDISTGEMNGNYGKYVWVNEKGPMVEGYVDDSSDYVYVLTSEDFPDIKNYERVSVEVTKVYDYTYNMGNGFSDLLQNNLDGYANEIQAMSDPLPISVARSEPSLMETQCVNATPIVNASGSSTQSEIRIGDNYVLGTTDSALNEDTTVGYRIQVSEQYPVKTVESVTYYFFTYDDWVSFTDCLNNVSNVDKGSALANQYADIVDAARHGDEYWSGRVHQFTVPINTAEWTSTSIPFVDVVYVDQEEPEVDQEEADYNPLSKGYVYYTNELERGQTWLFSFTTMDTYRMDYSNNENGEADYLYPYDNPLYRSGNANVYRSAPQQMDRQAPKVKMTMDYTEHVEETDSLGNKVESEEPVWSVWLYDPDQALGTRKIEITDATHGTRTETAVTWKSATTSGTAVDWSEFIVAGTVGTVDAVTAHMTGGDSGNSTNRPTIDWINTGEKPQKMSAADLEQVFGIEEDTDVYHKVLTEGPNCVDGVTWSGRFRMGNPVISGNLVEILQDEWQYTVFFARSLNDSEYLVTQEGYHDNLGVAGKYGLSNPSLYFMAAAQGIYDHVITPEELARVLKIQPQITTNKLLLSVSQTSAPEDTRLLEEVSQHLVGLKVSIYQAPTAEANKQYDRYELLTTEVLEYSTSGTGNFSIDLTALDRYQSGYGAAVTVEAVYDTGLSGTVLTKLGETAEEIYGDNLYESKDDLSYSVRRQGTDEWYTGLRQANNTHVLQGLKDTASGSIWKIAGNPDSGLSRTYTMKGDSMQSEASLAMAAASATDQKFLNDGYISDITKGATAGLRHNGTGGNVVFSLLASSSASLLDGDPLVSKEITASEAPITLDGKVIPEAGAGIFEMPEAVPAVTESTTIANYANKAEMNFYLSTSTRRLMEKKDGKERTFLPYIFVELYEETALSASSGKVTLTEAKNGVDYTTEQNYRISDAGTLITEGFEKEIMTKWGGTHTYNEKSYYNSMWGKAGAGAAADSVLHKVAAVDAVNESIGEVTDIGSRYQITLSNLIPGMNGESNYSVRLYVLPTVSGGDPVDYDIITSEQELQKYKRYLVDGSNSRDTTVSNRYYTTSLDMENWFRLRTNNYSSFSTALEAEYQAASYTSKYIEKTYALSNQTNADTYLQYKLTDEDGDLILDNDDIMSAMSNVDKLVGDEAFEYYDTDGTIQTRHIYSFTTSGEINVIDYLGEKLLPKHTYQLWAMVCYKDPTLVNLSDNYMKLGYASAAVLAAGENTTWNGSDIVEKFASNVDPATAFDDQVYTTSSGIGNGRTGGYYSVATFTMPEDASPTIVFSSIFGNKVDDGMQMTVQINMIDDRSTYFNAGVFGTSGNGSVEYGRYMVKIIEDAPDGTRTDVTGEFSCTGLQDGTVPANATNAFRSTRTGKWNYSYELEVWGTLNGQSHTTGSCPCGQDHGEPDDSGNIRLWTSADDTSNRKFLTLPGENGIAINDATVSVVGNNMFQINIMNGAGVTDIHSAKVTITNANGELKANLSFNNISWKLNGSTYSVQSGADTQIANLEKGNYRATIYFYTNAAGSGTQVTSISGINFTK